MADDKRAQSAAQAESAKLEKFILDQSNDTSVEADILQEILKKLDAIAAGSNKMSQTNAKERADDAQFIFRNKSKQPETGQDKRRPRGTIAEGIEDAIWESVLGSGYKEKIGKSMSELADKMGVDVKGIPREFGNRLGKELLQKAGSGELGGKLGQAISKVGTKLAGEASQASSILSSGMAEFTAAMGEGGAGAIAGTKALGASLFKAVAACPQLIAAFAVVAVAAWALGDTFEGLKKLAGAASKAMNRERESRKHNLELEKKRLEEDIKSLASAPFQILEDAAKKVYEAWDSNLRIINGTQGYSKEDLSGLMASYAARLRDDNLTKVVGGTDIISNLGKVLSSGLSGQVAEEFAYQATKLNAAIPTQDFFGYGETYASLAANAIRQGKSQAEAISYANEQLQLFASEVLYASRELAGGFSTGLKDASSIFSDALKITQAAKFGNPTDVASVLTSVSAITGAIAPDLASSVVSAVVNAAIGGNSPETVALRSLAGINASNTEFLKAFVSDPQSVFAQLFTTLSRYQNMSNDAFMEVADGLASIFGLSRDALSRVDFAYLAQAVSNMEITQSALNQNLEQLISGESTTSAEQMRMEKANQYLLEEGLSLVLDNEVGRAIQQHMWDEQLARELQETTYAVDLKGAALDFLEGIKSTIEKIINLLNPFAWLSKLINLIGTIEEGNALEADIRQSLLAGAVGKNLASLYQLTNRGQDLQLVQKYVDLQGGNSAYGAASSMRKSLYNSLMNTSLLGGFVTGGSGKNWLYQAMYGSTSPSAQSDRNYLESHSAYSWGTIGKSAASMLAQLSAPSGSSVASAVVNATQASQTAANNNIQRMLDTISESVEKQMSYDEWVDTAKSFGIADYAEAIKEYGLTENQIKDRFMAEQTNKGVEEKARREMLEERFWTDSIQYYIDDYDLSQKLYDVATDSNDLLSRILLCTADIQTKWKSFYSNWIDYFIQHNAYNSAYNYDSVAAIQRKERQGAQDAVYALAEALTQNAVDLKDPQVQTNAILSQILLVVQSIMQQGNNVGGSSLIDSIAALSMGVTI